MPKLTGTGPKKLLALDGGGIRGVIALDVLARVEELLGRAIRARDRMNLLFNAGRIPSALMYAALTEQDVLCRVFGDCLMGDVIDSELKDLIGEGGRGPVERKLFTYVRYTADLSRKGLDDLGLGHARPEEVQKLDSVDAIPQMREVGRAVAARKVHVEHFARFPA